MAGKEEKEEKEEEEKEEVVGPQLTADCTASKRQRWTSNLGSVLKDTDPVFNLVDCLLVGCLLVVGHTVVCEMMLQCASVTPCILKRLVHFGFYLYLQNRAVKSQPALLD